MSSVHAVTDDKKIHTGVTDGPALQRKLDEMYFYGWNSALEMAATKLQEEFKTSFGPDTLTSIAAYIREMKK